MLRLGLYSSQFSCCLVVLLSPPMAFANFCVCGWWDWFVVTIRMSSQLFCHLSPNEKCVEGKIQYFSWLNYGLDTQRAELMGASFLMGGWGSLVKTRWSTQVHKAQLLFLSLKRGKKEVPLWQMHCFVYMQYAICIMHHVVFMKACQPQCQMLI